MSTQGDPNKGTRQTNWVLSSKTMEIPHFSSNSRTTLLVPLKPLRNVSRTTLSEVEVEEETPGDEVMATEPERTKAKTSSKTLRTIMNPTFPSLPLPRTRKNSNLETWLFCVLKANHLSSTSSSSGLPSPSLLSSVISWLCCCSCSFQRARPYSNHSDSQTSWGQVDLKRSDE